MARGRVDRLLRLVRFRLPHADVDAFEAFARDVAVARVRDAGALAVVVGRHDEPSESPASSGSPERRYAVVSRYPGFETLVRIVGADLEHPQFLDHWRDRLLDPVADHYEAMDLDPRPPDDRAPTLLRIYAARIAEAHATEYYDFVRHVAWPTIRSRPGIAAAHFGRRVEEGEHALAFVTAWAVDDETATAPAADRPLQPSELVRDERIEHYDVVTAWLGPPPRSEA